MTQFLQKFINTHGDGLMNFIYNLTFFSFFGINKQKLVNFILEDSTIEIVIAALSNSEISKIVDVPRYIKKMM